MTKTNRYPGKCHRCGETVAAEAGETWVDDGEWVVAHRDGECGGGKAAPARALWAVPREGRTEAGNRGRGSAITDHWEPGAAAVSEEAHRLLAKAFAERPEPFPNAEERAAARWWPALWELDGYVARRRSTDELAEALEGADIAEMRGRVEREKTEILKRFGRESGGE